MKLKLRNPERTGLLIFGIAAWLVCGSQVARCETIILHLRNGDRVAGTILSEDTNSVRISTTWIKELAVPVSAIVQREPVTNAAPAAAVADQTPTATAPETAATQAPTSPPATTATTPTTAVAEQKPATPPPAVPSPPPATAAKTNAVAAAKPSPPIETPKPPPKAPQPRLWKINVNFGTDTLFGANDHQLYTGRLQLTYARPYKSNPKKFLRSIIDYAVDYGETEGVKSADRMYGTVKTDFDIGERLFIYNLVGAGYDNIRKIDFQYEAGPGFGYHLFTTPKFVGNVETGMNYQEQRRSAGGDVESFYFRLAEDVTWKITPKLTFDERVEFFPNAEKLEQYRARVEANLTFALLQNVSLKLSLLDLYDTDPATGVDNNELQIRSLVGVNF